MNDERGFWIKGRRRFFVVNGIRVHFSHELPSLLFVVDFWNPLSLKGYLAQPKQSREDLGPSSESCALPSLGSGSELGRKWREREEKRDWKLGLVCKINKDSFLKK